MRPPTPIATRLRANADALDELTVAVPGAYREQGPPSAGELAAVAARIGARHQLLLRTASVLAQTPLADTAQRAGARALADAGMRVGEALATISRASAMATRLHEVEGLDGRSPQDVREQAGRELNLSLSRTRLALTDAGEGLRREAREERDGASRAPGRHRAAVVRSVTARPALAVAPPAAALPQPALPVAASPRR
ncbi:hypothetical protein [Kitasatospora sp. NPDC057015]|uniref:hypothetical protein n=1 Tax=Kitasatospora sp. NPDC057015 TaxID=3346001 RepID=UPI003644484E